MIFTIAGEGMVGVSTIAAIFVPEGLPAEGTGIATGINVINFGDFLSFLGSTLQGAARGGLKGETTEGVIEIGAATGAQFITEHFLPGLSEADAALLEEALGNVPDALRTEETACARK